MKYFFWFFFIFLFFGVTGYGQSYRSLRGEGDDFFKGKYYELAAIRYEECHRIQPTDYPVSFNLGVSYLMLNRLKEAEDILLPVYQNKKKQLPNVVYYLGFLNQRNLRFRKAAKYYKEFLKKNAKGKFSEYVKTRLRNCENGILMKTQDVTAVVESIKGINSPRDDFHPIYSPNAQREKIYFSSNRVGVLGGLRDNMGKLDRERGRRNPDMFVMNRHPIAEVARFSGLLNTSLFDEVMGFSFDGQRMYYKKGYTKHAGLLYENDFISTDKDRLSSKLVDVPFDMKNGDATPFFFLDSVVFFASRNLGGFGGYDIFASSHTPDGWTDPVNLGAGINSSYDELHPFMTNNKQSIYFSSNRPEGMGGYDIYKSVYSTVLSRWNKARNKGIPINSADDDLYFQMADDGWHFVLSSNRPASMGKQDIFEGQFFEQQKDQVVMALMVEHNEVIDSTKRTSASVLFQKYPQGSVMPTEEQFLELLSLSEMCDQFPDAKMVLNIHMTTTNTKGFKDRLDPLSNVLISYINSKVSVPINITRRLLAPNKTLEVGTFVEAVLQFPEGGDVKPINEIKRHSFVPRLAQGMRYKIEVDGTSDTFDDFLMKNKYDFSFNIWPEEDEQIHILYREFFTYDSAQQWTEVLEGNNLKVKRIIPFFNGTAVDKIDNELISEFPELLEYFQNLSSK